MPPALRPATDGIVTIRPPAPGDAAVFISGRDDVFRRFLGDGSADPQPTACIVVGGEIVGWIDYERGRAWLEPGEVNVGYNVFAPHRGRGYATRALELLLEHLAADTDHHTATLLIHPENERSLAVARRAGFTQHDDVDGSRYFKRALMSASREVGRGFSRVSADYVDTTPQARRLLALAEVQPGERVLDVGCGPGTLTVLAADAVGPTGHVVAVDVADEMVVKARAAVRGHPNVDVHVMDATALEFDDDTFDAILANSVIQFSGPRSLAEWARVTVPGGRVACSLPWGPSLWLELCRRYVDQTVETYRSVAVGQMARAERRPDADFARERIGFAAVRTDREDIVQRFDDADDAWASLYTHGARLFLDALPDDALAAFRADFVAGVATPDGVELRSEFLYWCFS
jgi:SAM-dependent methyltransferase